jgi:hypothetical protein
MHKQKERPDCSGLFNVVALSKRLMLFLALFKGRNLCNVIL